MEPSKRRMKTTATQALNLTPIMICCPPLRCVSSGGLSFLLSLFTHALFSASLHHQHLSSLTQCFFDWVSVFAQTQIAWRILTLMFLCNFLFCVTPLFLHLQFIPPASLKLSWSLHYVVFLSLISCPALSVLSVSNDLAQSESID